ASAQSNTMPTAPAVGEGSTMSRGGEPNPTQRPDGSDPAMREAIKGDARVENRSHNPATPRGEPSTMQGGQPNANPEPTGAVPRTGVQPGSGQVGELPPPASTLPAPRRQ